VRTGKARRKKKKIEGFTRANKDWVICERCGQLLRAQDSGIASHRRKHGKGYGRDGTSGSNKSDRKHGSSRGH
jgi:hypothetical protein